MKTKEAYKLYFLLLRQYNLKNKNNNSVKVSHFFFFGGSKENVENDYGDIIFFYLTIQSLKQHFKKQVFTVF